MSENKSTEFTEVEFGNNSISMATPELLAKFGEQINPWIGISHRAFKEIVEDSKTVIENEISNYNKFLSVAETYIAELKKMDKTNSLNVKIDTAGFVKISTKKSAYAPGSNVSTDEIHRNKVKMQQWVKENEELIRETTKIGRKYALAKSVNDYEKATGINHKNLHTLKPRITKGSPSDFINQAKEDSIREIEYLSKMGRYASWKFATSPLSYKVIDNMGNPSFAPHSEGQRPALLPNMNDN
ncbi:hypothetical protein Q4493_14720 [Colwellia sp. 1_MG-2023]|uniref:hypothetical protein n=1 Tax=Colwellia sp. 1_MG-2023 TaxID=3062649 RepID=UPI0026E32346|nr:hypothetical protein [Colwellia sp. 1_MG-2023]MDO6447021.1 hypothetical protein [Colwellia sp. 1_MG-2023]